MKTNFWRIECDESQVEEMVAEGKVEFPDLSKWPNAKNDTCEKILEKLKIGQFVLLCQYDKPRQIGKCRWMGEVLTINGQEVTANWQKLIPTLELHPDTPGGVRQWEEEGVFCFDINPVKRYKLVQRSAKIFAH